MADQCKKNLQTTGHQHPHLGCSDIMHSEFHHPFTLFFSSLFSLVYCHAWTLKLQCRFCFCPHGPRKLRSLVWKQCFGALRSLFSAKGNFNALWLTRTWTGIRLGFCYGEGQDSMAFGIDFISGGFGVSPTGLLGDGHPAMEQQSSGRPTKRSMGAYQRVDAVQIHALDDAVMLQPDYYTG